MPAFGILAPVFLVVQALVSWFVYSEAKQYGSFSPLIAGSSVFILGVTLAFVFSTITEIVVGELLIILIYQIGVRVANRRSSPA